MQGIIQRVVGEFTDDNLPRFYSKDPWLSKNTLCLLDFGKAICWPSQAAPNHADPIINLVDNAINGVAIKATPTTNLQFREGGMDFLGVVNNYIALGGISENAFDLSLIGSPDFVGVVWIKRETGFSTANFPAVVGKGGSTAVTNHQMYVNLGVGGTGLVFGVSPAVSGSTGNTVNMTTITAFQAEWDALLNTTVQIGFSYENSVLSVFINGVLKGQNTPSLTLKPYASVPASRYTLGAGAGGAAFKGLIKRYGIEKLDGTKTAAQRVAEDYVLHRARLQTPS